MECLRPANLRSLPRRRAAALGAAALVALLALCGATQLSAQSYTDTNASTAWNAARWNNSADGPTYTDTYTAGNNVFFTAGSYSFAGMGAAINVGNVTISDNVTVTFTTNANTYATGGNVRTISVGAGSIFDTATQNFSTAAGTGFIKTGDGVWFSFNANTYAGGFTLDGGTFSLGGTVAMGSGTTNVLTLSNGVLAANGNRSLVDTRYGGGIRLHGNIQFGAMSNSYATNAQSIISDTASLSFANNVDLGGGTRTMTIGNLANHTFSGVISSGGLTIDAAPAVTGSMTLSGANTYTGKTTINSGTVILSGSGTAGATTSDLEVAGGVLNLGAGTKTNAAFTLSGGTITNGTLEATTYALQGGTIISNATLGTGTATVTTGTTTLNGLLNATTVNVNSGTLNLGAADRLANGAAVTVGGGTLGMGTFSDLVSSFTISSGTLSGSTGVLTASTYALQGGTINAVLGAGAATVTDGTTILGSAGRLSAATALTVNSGQLTLSGNETISTYTQTGGTLNGSGQTLSAGSYALQGGTVTANLGTGTATASTGTTTIDGNLGGALTSSGGTANLNGTVTGAVTVSGGTVNLGSADRIGNSSAVTVSSGALNLNGNDTVGAVTLTGGTIGGSGTLTGTGYTVQTGAISAALGGAGAMIKTGAGTTTLSANNSGYSGAVTVNDGAILAGTSGALGTGAVAMTSGSTLAANGVTLANNFTIGTSESITTNATTTDFTAYWNFGTDAGNASTTSSSGSGVTFGEVSRGNSGTTTLLETTSASSGYTDASGQFNAGAAAAGGALNTASSAYFEFTLTSDAGYELSLTNLTFGSRSTGTGPSLASIRSSLDSYAANLGSASLTTNSTWRLTSPGIAASTLNDGVVSFRIYGSDGTGSTVNVWRIDDLNLSGFTVTNSFTTNEATGIGTLGIGEAGEATFSGNILNNNEATLTAASGGQATFSGIISGEGSVTKTGAGTAVLSGANTYGGATTIAGGTLRIDGNARLGNTNTTITLSNAGILEVTAAGTLTNDITIGAGNGVLSNSSAGALVIAGAVSKDGTVFTSRSGSGTNVFAGVISGANANSDFIVDGGTTVFSNQMTYNGPTIITNGGTLVLGTNNATPATSGLVLGGGTLLIGDATTRYSATFASLTLTADSTIDMGATGGLGTLTFGDSSAIEWAGTFTITNWQGVANQTSDVTKLLFGSITGLTGAQLGQIQFAGYDPQGGVLLGAEGELAPIPEAPVVWGAVAVTAFIFWRERRRLLALVMRRRE